jgi:predicted transposase YbfD/YdcC
LAVKGNQPSLYGAVEAVFAAACERDLVGAAMGGPATVADGHGRHEERYVTVLTAPEGLPDEWPDGAAVAQVNRERAVDGKNTSTTHFYLTSYAGPAAEIAGWIRGHWEIANGLHGVLDVVFREDDSRVREGNAGANLAMRRRVAVSLLKRAPGKGTTPTKRLKAGWDDDYLLQVLQGITGP